MASWVVKRINDVRVWPKDKLIRLIKMLRSLLKSHCRWDIFEHFMTFCVVLNTIVMALDRYGIEE